MTTVIVPVNAYAASLSIPADGEGVSSSSVALYVQEIANRLEFLRRRVLGASDSSNAISFRLDASQAQIFNGSAIYRISSSLGVAPTVDNLVVSATETFLVPYPYLVPGSMIRGFGGLYRGAGAHAALPAVMPKVELVTATWLPGGSTTPTLTAVDSQSDTSGTTAALQLSHYVSKNISPITVTDPVMYFLRMTGESGANSLVGGQWSSFYLQISGN